MEDTTDGGGGPFVIEPTKDKTGAVVNTPFLTHLTDYEDCRIWEFDLVATTPAGKTSVCQMRWKVIDASDRPFYTEAITGGNRYGVSSVPPALASLTDAREVEERSLSNTAVGAALEAKDSDVGQEIFFQVR